MNFQRKYSPTQVAQILGVTTSTIYANLSRGELRGFHEGRRRVITHDQLVDFLRVKGKDFVDRRYDPTIRH
jgi:excisionase family DNA binding protein